MSAVSHRHTFNGNARDTAKKPTSASLRITSVVALKQRWTSVISLSLCLFSKYREVSHFHSTTLNRHGQNAADLILGWFIFRNH